MIMTAGLLCQLVDLVIEILTVLLSMAYMGTGAQQSDSLMYFSLLTLQSCQVG